MTARVQLFANVDGDILCVDRELGVMRLPAIDGHALRHYKIDYVLVTADDGSAEWRRISFSPRTKTLTPSD